MTIDKDCLGPCPGVMFSITVTGNNPQPSSFTFGNEQDQDVTLGPGSFTVTETPVTGFLTVFVGDCTQTLALIRQLVP
ncbi:MAG TPA: hypothetical protein VE223_04175 [Nitrososphaeraceae archaeon]|nr:hypothetical protein [Nitrososphaeraceae archaeon]